ncbi:MAG TPA: RcnB family protein [Phenylobacterium sp.]|nr:RcnB family protein [Phenylobacterium sp.]
MRRLISALAAVVLVAAPLATAGGAMAKDHRDERREQPAARGGGARQQQAQPYRGGAQEPRGGERIERADPRNDPRSDPRNDPRYDPRNGYQAERVDPRYDPRYSQPPSGYQNAPRRGGYLPQGGPVIQDPGRYRLRPPPRGYDWVRTPGGMALVQQGTGRVYDVVPNE